MVLEDFNKQIKELSAFKKFEDYNFKLKRHGESIELHVTDAYNEDRELCLLSFSIFDRIVGNNLIVYADYEYTKYDDSVLTEEEINKVKYIRAYLKEKH